jgi:L-cysteine/cystine lyase
MRPKIDWGEIRRKYPTLSQCTYLNYGAAGPLSEDALAAIFHSYEVIETYGTFSIESNLYIEEELAATRSLLEGAIGAPAGSVALSESICHGCNGILWSIDWRPGDHIVTSTCENPGIVAAIRAIEQRFEVRVSYCPVSASEGVTDPAAAIAAAITPKTRLVVLSHILQATGEEQPVAEIAERCGSFNTARGPVAVLVDGAQAVGAIDVNVFELGVDYYAFTGHKWCCGPGGLAAVFVRPDRVDSLNGPAGWRSLRHGVRGVFEWQPDARRLEQGTSAYPLCAGLREAFRLHDGVASFSDRQRITKERVAFLLQELEQVGASLSLVTEPRSANRNGIVSFSIEGVSPGHLVKYLESRQILVRAMEKPSCVRVCVHYLTSEDEIGRLADEINRFLTTRILRTI